MAWIRVPVAFGLAFLAALVTGAPPAKSATCVFTLQIPKLHVFPLFKNVKGDADMAGSPPRVDLTATLHQPLYAKGGQAKNLRLDLDVRIADFKGDGTTFEGKQSFWIGDRWIVGGNRAEMGACLDQRFRACVEAFKDEARSERQLQAQCGRGAQVKIVDNFKADTGSNSRQWTTYVKKTAKLVQSAECLGDSAGEDAGKIGCRNITFRKGIKVDVNFGHTPLPR